MRSIGRGWAAWVVMAALGHPLAAQLERGAEPVPVNPEEVLAAIRDNYPTALWDIRASGHPILRVHVDEFGEVDDVDVIDAGGHRFFAEAAVKVAESMRFEPALENGVAVGKELEVPVDFEVPLPLELLGLDETEFPDTPDPNHTPPQLTNRDEIAEALRRFYPQRLARAGRSGRVELLLKIDSSGLLRSLEVHKSSGILPIDEAALAVGSFMRFVPATDDGQPSPAVVTQWLVFSVR